VALRRNRIPQTRKAIIDAASRGVARAGGFIVDLAQQLSPVDTGALKASIRLEPSEPAPVMTVKAGGGSVNYASWVEHGTSRSPAQPFLTPAAKAISVAKEVRAEIKKAVKR
jgi:HK97 gp10 family phage protein